MPPKHAPRRAPKNTGLIAFIISLLALMGVLGIGGIYFVPPIVRAAQENRAPQVIVLHPPTQAVTMTPFHTPTPASAATLRPTADLLSSPTPLPPCIAAPGT